MEPFRLALAQDGSVLYVLERGEGEGVHRADDDSDASDDDTHKNGIPQITRQRRSSRHGLPQKPITTNSTITIKITITMTISVTITISFTIPTTLLSHS